MTWKPQRDWCQYRDAMSILITGFEPFAGATINPAAELAGRLAADYVTAILPVDFQALTPRLAELLSQHRPTAVVSLGLSATATALTYERVAINLIDAAIPDNRGAQPVDVQVVAAGPSAHFTTLPVKAMAQATRQAGVSAELSLSAGSYACNAVMYLSLDLTSSWSPPPRCGFIHVPPLSVMDLDTQERGLRAGLAQIEATEVHHPGGALD